MYLVPMVLLGYITKSFVVLAEGFVLNLHATDFSLSPISVINRVCNDFKTGGLYYPVVLAYFGAGYLSYAIRMAIAVIFVGSFLVKPLLMRPLSLIWLRIVESDKPIFTLVSVGLQRARYWSAKYRSTYR